MLGGSGLLTVSYWRWKLPAFARGFITVVGCPVATRKVTRRSDVPRVSLVDMGQHLVCVRIASAASALLPRPR